MADNSLMKINNKSITKGQIAIISIVLFFFVVIILWQWNNMLKILGSGKSEKVVVFDSNDMRLKIIVTSFRTNCGNGTNSGQKYYEYLDYLNENDSLNIFPFYYETGAHYATSADSALMMLKRNNADVLIYEDKDTNLVPGIVKTKYIVSNSFKQRIKGTELLTQKKENEIDNEDICAHTFEPAPKALIYYYSGVKEYEYENFAKAVEKLKIAEQYTNDSNMYLNKYLGESYGKINEVRRAEKYLKKNIELAQGNADSALLISCYDDISIMYITNNMFKAALKYGLEAQAMKERQTIVDSVALATSYNNNAIAYYYIKEMERAKMLINKAVSIRKKLFHAEHPDVQDALKNRRVIYQDELKKRMGAE